MIKIITLLRTQISQAEIQFFENFYNGKVMLTSFKEGAIVLKMWVEVR
jgi:hypothetical protein